VSYSSTSLYLSLALLTPLTPLLVGLGISQIQDLSSHSGGGGEGGGGLFIVEVVTPEAMACLDNFITRDGGRLLFNMTGVQNCHSPQRA
jgi:hypothetical protein